VATLKLEQCSGITSKATQNKHSCLCYLEEKRATYESLQRSLKLSYIESAASISSRRPIIQFNS